jgi:uncharacterized RDD family membrane protein YckC
MRSIDITTTQSVTIEYEMASLRERFFALLIDLVIIVFIQIFIIFLLATSLGGNESRAPSTFVSILISGGLMILYSLTCESLLDGQTIGKRALNIKVVRVDGKPVGFSDLMLRSLLILVDFYYSFGIVGTLLISSSENQQRLGDMAAGTTVIKIKSDNLYSLSDILGINTLENYTPRYPQVRQMSEEDMLLIKSSILRYQQYPNGAHEDALRTLVVHVCGVLDVQMPNTKKVDFLKTLLKDYIVLTR